MKLVIDLDLASLPAGYYVAAGVLLWYLLMGLVCRGFEGDLGDWLASPIWVGVAVGAGLLGLAAWVLSFGYFQDVWTKDYWRNLLPPGVVP